MLGTPNSKLAILQIASGIALFVAVVILRGNSLQFVLIYTPFQIAAGIYSSVLAKDYSKKSVARAEYTSFLAYTIIYLGIISPLFLSMFIGGISLSLNDLEGIMPCDTEDHEAGMPCPQLSENPGYTSASDRMAQFSLFTVISLVGIASSTIFLLQIISSVRSQSKAQTTNT